MTKTTTKGITVHLRKHGCLFVLLVSALFCTFPVYAQTSLWQISKGDHIAYIGGTIHVLSDADYPLPGEFQLAFEKSDQLVFETDIAKAKSPEFAQKMMTQMLYPQGQSLQNKISQKTYKKLTNYFANKIAMEQINTLRPGMVVIMLSAMEFQRIGMTSAGVDEHFWLLAQQQEKKLNYLETLDEQLSFMANMGKGNEDELILNSLNELSKIEAMIASLKQAWRLGDELEMENIVLKDMISDYPKLYQELLVTRNNNWLPSIEQMIFDDDVSLILVGALHLVGDDGLLQMLRDKGYDVKHF
ncbi:MAG: TraB/GumN family protein [Gammaproteobacteria bacterium]|nr:TraB/GumN family protein [Gammaproteobacteria bacterium]